MIIEYVRDEREILPLLPFFFPLQTEKHMLFVLSFRFLSIFLPPIFLFHVTHVSRFLNYEQFKFEV